MVILSIKKSRVGVEFLVFSFMIPQYMSFFFLYLFPVYRIRW